MKKTTTTIVCELPNGFALYRKPNGCGGHTYFSDEVGGGVTVWDTCLVSHETLLIALMEERKRIKEENGDKSTEHE